MRPTTVAKIQESLTSIVKVLEDALKSKRTACNDQGLIEALKIAQELESTISAGKNLVQFYEAVKSVETFPLSRISAESMQPQRIIQVIQEFLTKSGIKNHRSFKLRCLIVPKTSSRARRNSENSAKSTCHGRRLSCEPLFQFTCNTLTSVHCPEASTEEMKTDKVIASALFSQMGVGLRKAFLEHRNVQTVIIRSSNKIAKDILRRNLQERREEMNDEMFLEDVSRDFLQANISQNALRKLKQTLKEKFKVSLPSEKKLSDARLRAKLACSVATGLKAIRNGYSNTLRTLVEREVTRWLLTHTISKKGKEFKVPTVNEEFRRRLQKEWVIKLTVDARRTTRNINHTEVMMMLLPTEGDSIDECIRRCQSPVEYRTVAIWEGNDHRDNIQSNMSGIFKEIRDLEEHGILCHIDGNQEFRICGVLDKNTSLMEQFHSRDKSKDHELFWESFESVAEGAEEDVPQGWRGASEETLKAEGLEKMGIRFVLTADMCALAGTLGHGCCGNEFCVDCKAHKNDRNIPYEFVTTEEEMTMEALALKYNCDVPLLCALNSEKGRTGLYHTFCEKQLNAQTHQDLSSIEHSGSQKKGARTSQCNVSVGQFPDSRNSNKRRLQLTDSIDTSNEKKRKISINQLSDVLRSLTTSDWQPESLSKQSIPKGTQVRVPWVHRKSRRSEWLYTLWPNYITFLCALHCLMRVTEGLLLVISDIAQNGGLVDKLNEGLAMIGLKKALKLEGSGSSKYYEKITLLGTEASHLLRLDRSTEQMMIEKLLRHIWPTGEARRSSSSPLLKTFVDDTINIWKEWADVVRMLREKDPRKLDQVKFATSCTKFVCLFQNQFHGDYCKAFYLHTLLCHAAESMKNALKLGITLGCLQNEGAENRHMYGRRAAKKSFWGGRWRTKYPNSENLENVSCYLCMMEILVQEGYEDNGKQGIIDHIEFGATSANEDHNFSDGGADTAKDDDDEEDDICNYDGVREDHHGKKKYFPDLDRAFHSAVMASKEEGYGSDEASDEETSIDNISWNINDLEFSSGSDSSDNEFEDARDEESDHESSED